MHLYRKTEIDDWKWHEILLEFICTYPGNLSKYKRYSKNQKVYFYTFLRFFAKSISNKIFSFLLWILEILTSWLSCVSSSTNNLSFSASFRYLFIWGSYKCPSQWQYASTGPFTKKFFDFVCSGGCVGLLIVKRSNYYNKIQSKLLLFTYLIKYLLCRQRFCIWPFEIFVVNA